MKTGSIQMILSSKFGPQEKYSKEQLQEITSLTINRFDIVGDFLSIDPEELLQFPNLKRLALNQCALGDDFIAIITQLKNLESLNLYHCEFMGDASEIFHMPYLKSLLFDDTEIPLSYLNDGMFTSLIFSNNTIQEDAFFYADKVDIRDNEILNYSFLRSKIDKLVVTKSQYESSPELQNYSSYIEIRDDVDPETVLEEVNRL